MKTPIILLTLTLLFIHADALRCRQSSCVGIQTCHSRTVTCPSSVDRCMVLIKNNPILIFTRGCATEANCKKMQIFEPTTRCCSTDLCN